MRLQIEVVPVSAAQVGLLVTNTATREPVEALRICSRGELVAVRARLLDRWASDPAVLAIEAPAIPAWALNSVYYGGTTVCRN